MCPLPCTLIIFIMFNKKHGCQEKKIPTNIPSGMAVTSSLRTIPVGCFNYLTLLYGLVGKGALNSGRLIFMNSYETWSQRF